MRFTSLLFTRLGASWRNSARLARVVCCDFYAPSLPNLFLGLRLSRGAHEP
jgi:hypothetical protein